MRALRRNLQTGKVEAKRVLRTTVRRVARVLTLHLADARTGQPVEAITTTANHPFYVAGVGFVEAEKLGIGCQIVTRAGPRLVVRSVEWKARPEGYLVYNLEVEGDHTYFVGTANGGAWVHNDCGLRPLGNGVWESPGGLRFGPGGPQGHRLAHVMEHLAPNLAKPVHTVFDVQGHLIKTLDEAWAARGPGVVQGARRVFDVNLGRVIGTAGETNLRIVVTNGTSNIITAYPFH